MSKPSASRSKSPLGVLLAGGSGTRLRPLTTTVSKHLLPVYDKPLLYFSLSNLMLAGIREIEIVVKPSDRSAIEGLLGSGGQLGLEVSYREQVKPRGIVDGLLLSASMHPGRPILLALGDNIFHGSGLSTSLRGLVNQIDGGAVLLKRSNEPQHFGVAQLREDASIEHVIEKPTGLSSGLVVTGLYSFGGDVVTKAFEISQSARGEFEIADLLNSYAADSRLHHSILPRGTVWKDAGSFEGLYEAQTYVRTMQNLTGQLVGSPEEIAWRNGWISDSELGTLAQNCPSDYGEKLRQLLKP